MNYCKKIVLITTGQPSVNPRAVKEADALQAAGYDVTMLYSFFIKWANEKDKVLLKNVSWKNKMVGGEDGENKMAYLFTRLKFKINRILNKYLGNNFLIAERAQARAYDELLKEAKKVKADFYIGHNLGALSIAVKAAKYNNAKAGFDFEDYHRGEGHDEKTLKRIIYLENKYMQSLFYYSTASDFITDQTRLNHPYFKGKVVTILNCFPLLQQPIFKEKAINDITLHLFWFSQTIGLNRGIEILIEALCIIDNSSIHLTLAGRVDNEFINYIRINSGKAFPNIHFAGIIQPEELPCFSSKFDIGLALETGFSINNDIALSNKIFTYLLAGNAIVLSNTTMQKSFNEQYKIGESFSINNANELAEKITFYFDTKKLNEQRKSNFELAKNTLNWEKESQKLLDIIN